MALYYAETLTSPEFGALVNAQTIGILPVAAIEPHGPHLPLGTDCDIARGHLAALPDYVPEHISALVLPLQAVGHSLEHQGFAGNFTHAAETLLAAWTDIAASFYQAGGRKLIIVSSHGGNSEIVGLLITRLRAQWRFLAVSAAWLRFGQPGGLFEAAELAYGIHGGAVETSLMLHYCPDKVRRGKLDNFISNAQVWDEDSSALKVHGKTRLGWLSRDLNREGAVGAANNGSAEKGALSAHHALSGFADLLNDLARFDLSRMETEWPKI